MLIEVGEMNAMSNYIYNNWLQWGRHEDLSARKSDIHRGHKAEVNITFKGRSILLSTEIEVNYCLLNDF